MLPPVPFHGRYQAGILPQSQRQTAVISFNATADGRAELTELFRTITDAGQVPDRGRDSAAGRHRRRRRPIPACSGRPWCRTA